MNTRKLGFVPFANESDVVHVGRLAIENRLDRISLTGDTDLTADQVGLARARELHALLGDIVASLEGRTLPAILPAAPRGAVDNPFA